MQSLIRARYRLARSRTRSSPALTGFPRWWRPTTPGARSRTPSPHRLREAGQARMHTYALALDVQAKLYLPEMFVAGDYQILLDPCPIRLKPRSFRASQ